MLHMRALLGALVLTASVITAPAAMAADAIDVTLANGGATTEVTTTNSTQTVNVHFDAAGGQHVILFCDTTSDSSVLRTWVYDKKNQRVLIDSWSGCFRHVLPEPAFNEQAIEHDGPYKLVLAPNNGQPFTVKLSYRAFDDVHTHVALDGSPVTFAPTAKGQNGLFTFDGKAGDRVRVTCESSVTGRGVSGFLLDANGKVVPNDASPQTWGWCQHGDLFDYTPTLPADGAYTLLLENSWMTDLGATVTLSKTLPTVTVAAPTDGTPFTLTTTGPGQNAKATFTLGANEHALITCEQRGDTPQWTPTLLFAPPTQYVPAESRVCRHAPSAEGRIVMDSEWNWTPGPHTFEVDPRDGATDSFDLRIFKVRDPFTVVRFFDHPLAVTTTQAAQNARFGFYAFQGDRISATCQLASGTARTTVYGPSGTVVATGTCATALMAVTTMPETGSYTAVVDWPGLDTNTVTVNFHTEKP